ncbi:B-cell receptor CD22 [Pleuronectes platessa]|uniref:B-cell receptor CD22 n=1 Tax=Pleuronectes platessa TaxID=8262 RepID=UPI00232A6959|nr:B-cell receptor CD22 [Pleuronectes platessa]
MGLREAASCFVIFLLSVSVVQGVDPWGVRCTPTQICAVKGSQVQIRGSYWHPSRIDGHDVAVEKTLWFTKVQDGQPVDLRSASEYTGRVKYDCGNKACTLTITDLRDSDSDVYQFRFTTNQPTGSLTGSPGVTLSVTGVQAHIPKSSSCWWYDCSKSRVECQTSCSPTPSPSYIWYKNGKKTPGEQSYTAYFYSADSISCAVRGHEDFPSAPVCVHGNSCYRVNYINRNICAFKGSSVDISCSYNSQSNPITSKSWLVAEREDVQLYRPQAVDLLKDPEFTHRVQVLDPEPGRSTLRIMNLRLSDSAQYRFTFKSQWFEWERSFPGTTLTVTDVQVICSPIGPTLTCHSSCLLSGRPSFVWFKNGTEVHGETSPTFRGFLHPENNYSCAYEHHHSSPVYAPKVPLVQLSQPGDILKDSSVSLTCSSDANPPPAYTWYKENQTLLNRAAQLVFSSIPLSDSGEYYCTAENALGKTASKRVLINVKYAVSVSPSGEIMEGSSVTLTCSSDANPAANYTWYKENQTLLQGPEGVYRLSSISSGDSGVYSCKSENQYGRINSTVVQCENGWDVSYTSTEICAVRGSTVDITCTYTYPSTFNNHDTTVQEPFWFIKESNGIHVDLRTDPEYSGRVENLCGNNKCTLRISNLRESDSAVYKFRFTTNQPTGSLTGSAGVTLSVTDLHVQVRASVKNSYDSSIWAELRCQSSCRLPDHLNYVWYKNQQKRKEGESYSGHFQSADTVSCAVKGHEDFRSPSMLVSQNGWDVSYTSTEICAVRGSTVDINCTYTYPSTFNNHDTTVQETFWLIKESNGIHVDLSTDPEYSGRVQNLCENNKCTLRISNLRESDSAVYKFRFTTNQPTGSLNGFAGVTLSVTDPQLQVHVRRSTANPSSTWTELTCHSRCQLPDHLSYVWYNNNKPVGRKKYFHLRHFNAEDSYQCAIEGHERFTSPTLYAPKPPSVSVSPSGEIMEGSSVTLTCSSDANPAAKYTWYKRRGDKQVQHLSEETQFVLSSIRSSDSGEYYCTAENELGNTASKRVLINVKYAPKPPSVSVSPSGEIMEGSSVTLTCSSDANPAAKYTWYKEDEDSPTASGQIFTITDITAEHGGKYQCEAQNTDGRSKATLHLTVGAGDCSTLTSTAYNPPPHLSPFHYIRTLNHQYSGFPDVTAVYQAHHIAHEQY